MLTNIKYAKIKDKKVKGTKDLLTQFNDKHTYYGATKPERKSTSVVLILKFSANHVYNLRPRTYLS